MYDVLQARGHQVAYGADILAQRIVQPLFEHIRSLLKHFRTPLQPRSLGFGRCSL